MKKAKRPFKLDFSSQWETHKELFTLELDANDIYEWKVGDSIPELGANIFQLEFYGLDLDVGSEILLGTVLFDSCDWGLEIHKVVSDAWYEATHPWLDYADAVKKKAFEKVPHFDVLTIYENDSSLIHDYHIGTTTGLNAIGDSSIIVAFKPIKPFEYAYFDSVEVWQG